MDNLEKGEALPGTLVMAYDGDNAGRMVGRAILADDEKALGEVSQRIDLGHEIVTNWVKKMGGTRISGGGDEGSFRVPESAIDQLEELRADYNYATDLTMTIGVGHSLSEAGKSLMVGKSRGKDMVCFYDETVEHDYAALQTEENEGFADPNKKIKELYMTPEQKSEGQPEGHSDCPYCAEMDGATEHSDNCPHCEEYDAKNQGTDDESNHEDCPYCKEMEEKPSECTHCDDYDARAAEAGVSPEGEEQAGPQDPSSIPQDAESVLDQINQEPGEPPVDAMSDDAAALGDDMDENASHPAGYDDESKPQDMGLAEDEDPNDSPDLSDVLRSNLDEHADSIQREKVIDMVSQALEGFKASKEVLERAKEQAPELYGASIAMLKAMIEMSKMLGLSPTEPSEEPAQTEEQGEAPQDAAPEEGAAQAPQQ